MNIDRNTVSVVTGAGSGIGRALALRLAREGSSLALADVNADGLEQAAQMAETHGAEVSRHIVDVSDSERVAQFAQEVIARHGRASILVNNAGVGLYGVIEQLSINDIDWLMGVNFRGVVHGVKHFLPILRQQPEAYVLNVSSVFGFVAPPGQGAYCASKFAVRGFTEALRHELHGTNVHVAAIHPGGVKTAIARNARVGAGAEASYAVEAAVDFDKLARTTPEAAAERIIKGIRRNRERILIGPDAKGIEILQRLMPVKYWRVMGAWLEKQTGKKML
ncbi:MAG: SDR family NAD(P)-dependent oxidoreductase [Acidobacteria bacterium]|nr:SDR family NAD(P)-dependent oxidoreductase [Acidobacteriota bacterium]